MSLDKVIITAGGTGGHIYPAIAIADSLKRKNPAIKILFVGAEGKMEIEKVPKAGFDIIGLPIAGINRSHFWKNILLPLKLLKSILRANKIIRDFQPNTIIGFGGYASGPILLLAKSKRIPYFIQEQNSFAGLTNKLVAKNAQKIFVAYPNMEKFFPKEKIIWTGNPVRQELIENKHSKESALNHFGLKNNKTTLLIIGGSQGARSINQSIAQGLAQLDKDSVQLIWQTGISFEKEAQILLKNQKDLVHYCAAFIYEMDQAYSAADIILSRAGALSVSEICLSAKPSILIPFPNAAEDHQTENAKVLEKAKAAILIPDNQAQSKLIPHLLDLIQQPEEQINMGKQAWSLAKPNSTQDICEAILTNFN